MDEDFSSDEINIKFEPLNDTNSSDSEDSVPSLNKKIKLEEIEWSSDLQKINPEPFKEPVGPLHDLPPGSTEEDFFSLFLDDKFYELLSAETNKYAQYCQTLKLKNNLKWHEISAREIKAYIGILIYMGIVHLPQIEDYFSSEFCDCWIVRNAMSCKRFQMISRFLHLHDETQQPDPYDPNPDILYNVRPILDLTKKYKEHFQPGCNLSIAEATIGFNGRFISQQYKEEKPTKRRIKVWVIVDSLTKYVLSTLIYTGQKSFRKENLSLSEQVVIDLGQDFFGKYHHLYFDHFFTSLKILQLLLNEKTYACGTVKNVKKDWPTELTSQEKEKLKPGEFKIFQSEKITAVLWHQKRDVKFLSTGIDPTQHTAKHKNVPDQMRCPLVVKKYYENYGGVDLLGQKRSYSIGRPNSKWWKQFINFIIDTSVINSYVLFDLTNRPQSTAHGCRQLNFRKNLVKQLIGDFTSRCRFSEQNHRIPSKSTLQQPSFPHHLIKNPNNPRRCRFCKVQGIMRRTIYYCQECDVPLCKDQFLFYHNANYKT